MIGALCATGVADQIEVGAERFLRAQVVGLESGELRFRTKNYDLLGASVADVSLMFVDSVGGMDDFNTAEQYVRDGEAEHAITRYERALRTAEGFWPALIRVRLLRACDRAGRVDKAVANFLRLLNAPEPGIEAVCRMIPSRFPDQETSASRRAVGQLDRSAEAYKDAPRRTLVLLLRYDLLRSVGSSRSGPMSPTIAGLVIPPAIRTARTGSIQLAALRAVFAGAADAEAYAKLDRAIGHAPDDVVPDLLLLKGRTLLRDAKTREDLLHAGLALMRVVVHFKDDPRAAEALIDAAKVHERIGRPDRAAALLKECLSRPQLDAGVRSRAQSALTALGSAEATPGLSAKPAAGPRSPRARMGAGEGRDGD